MLTYFARRKVILKLRAKMMLMKKQIASQLAKATRYISPLVFLLMLIEKFLLCHSSSAKTFTVRNLLVGTYPIFIVCSMVWWIGDNLVKMQQKADRA